MARSGCRYFVLTANAAGAALLLTQEERVVRDRSADQILGALTGVTMSPDDLQAVLTGCVVPSPRPVAGRLHAGGWASIDLDGGATLYLRRSGDSWRLRAARRGDWLVEYPEWSPASPFPARVWLQSAAPVAVDLIASMSQVETNTDLDEAAFAVVIPQNARPLTLEELRESGPLRER